MKIEYKSYKKESIAKFASDEGLKKQLFSYFGDPDATSIDKIEYSFNQLKANAYDFDINYVKGEFQKAFQAEGYKMYDDVNNSGLWTSLEIFNKQDFIEVVDMLNDDLFSFLKIE